MKQISSDMDNLTYHSKRLAYLLRHSKLPNHNGWIKVDVVQNEFDVSLQMWLMLSRCSTSISRLVIKQRHPLQCHLGVLLEEGIYGCWCKFGSRYGLHLRGVSAKVLRVRMTICRFTLCCLWYYLPYVRNLYYPKEEWLAAGGHHSLDVWYAMGTSQKLDWLSEKLFLIDEDVQVAELGQELNEQTFAIAKANMLIKGVEVEMKHDNTLSDDKFESYKIDYISLLSRRTKRLPLKQSVPYLLCFGVIKYRII